MSVEVVEHLDESKLADFLHVLRGMLDPNGIVEITTSNNETLAASEVYCPCCDHVFHRWQHLHSFTSKSLGQLVEEYSLDVIQTYTTNFVQGKFRIPGSG